MRVLMLLLFLGCSGPAHAGKPKKAKAIPATRAVKKAKKYQGCHWLMANYSGNKLKKGRRHIELKPGHVKLGKHTYDVKGKKNRLAFASMLQSCGEMLQIEERRMHNSKAEWPATAFTFLTWRSGIFVTPLLGPLAPIGIIQTQAEKRNLKKYLNAFGKRADALRKKQRNPAKALKGRCSENSGESPRGLSQLRAAVTSCEDYIDAVQPQVPWLADLKKDLAQKMPDIERLKKELLSANGADLNAKCQPGRTSFHDTAEACWGLWSIHRSRVGVQGQAGVGSLARLKKNFAKVIFDREAHLFDAIRKERMDEAHKIATDLNTRVSSSRSDTLFSYSNGLSSGSPRLEMNRTAKPSSSNCGLLNRAYAKYARTGTYGEFDHKDYAKFKPLIEYIGRSHVCGEKAVAKTKEEVGLTVQLTETVTTAKLIGTYVCRGGSSGGSILKLDPDHRYLSTYGNNWDAGTWKRKNDSLILHTDKTDRNPGYYDPRLDRTWVYDISGRSLIYNGRTANTICQ